MSQILAGAHSAPVSQVFAVAERAQWLIADDQWDEARVLLGSLESNLQARPDIQRLLLAVYKHDRDFVRYCRTCRRLIESDAEDRNLWLLLAEGSKQGGYSISSLAALRTFLEKWPDDPQADRARETCASLENDVDRALRDEHFPPDEKIELGTLHEELIWSVLTADFADAIEKGERLLARCPNYVRALINLAEAHHHAGRTAEALDLTGRALEHDPENVHALANSATYLLLSGRRAEAETRLSRMASVQLNECLNWCVKASALSLFGDDAAVIETFDDALRCGMLAKMRAIEGAEFSHLAAVAFARQGNVERARELWHVALRNAPTLQVAKANLSNVDRPAAVRHGPWPCTLSRWIHPATIVRLKALVDDLNSKGFSESGSQRARSFLADEPAIGELIPLILDRGDPWGRALAADLASLADTPELDAVLRTFCCSQRGPDEWRLKIANQLVRRGALPPGPTRLWVDGEWKDVELNGWTIISQPSGPPASTRVAELTAEAIQAQNQGNVALAEELLKRCLEIGGEHPGILYNLSNVYGLQGRSDDSLQLDRMVHDRWPDDIMGCLAMAIRAIRQGDCKSAEAILAPVRRRPQMHIVEFGDMCMVFVLIEARRGQIEAGTRWLNVLKSVDPNHRHIAELESRLEPSEDES